MKKLVSVLMAVLTALTLCACGKNGKIHSEPVLTESLAAADAIVTGPSAEPFTEQPTAAPTDGSSLSELDIPVYADDAEWMKFWKGYGADSFFGVYSSGIGVSLQTSELLKLYPTNAVRQRGDGIQYAVYDTESGYRVYVFLGDPHNSGDSMVIGYRLLINKILSYADFASVKVGDSIRTVAKIEPYADRFADAMIEWCSQEEVNHKAEVGFPYASLHYLTDGIIKIEYEMTDGKELIVSNIVYAEDYVLTHNPYGLEQVMLDYRIYPEDLPPQE